MFTATSITGMYRFCTSLSLHDALPIFRAGAERALQDEPCEGRAGQAARCHWTGRARVRANRREDRWKRKSAPRPQGGGPPDVWRSEEHTSELQSLMRISYAVFCLKKKQNTLQSYDYVHIRLTY